MADSSGELIGGRYRFVESVGQGSTGRVWRGHDERLKREVALKEILLPPDLNETRRDEISRRVVRGARAAARLNHPGIITVHDVVEYQGGPVIVMEFISGRSLAAMLDDQERMPTARVAEIGVAVLDALAQAHAAGIVHRDLKPDNIMLAGRRVVITDFGLATIADLAMSLTNTGIFIGTPLYMSPEQLEGEPATSACDLWALGATLYTAVEGRTPFDGTTAPALMFAICHREPEPFRHAGPLAPTLAKLLDKDPTRRPSAATAAEALSLHTGPAPAAPASAPTHCAPHSPPIPAAEQVPVVPAPASGPARLPSAPARLSDPRPDISPENWTRRTLHGHAESVASVAFSPSGAILASGGHDGAVCLWDVGSGGGRATLSGHTDWVTSVAFSPDGRTLATGSTDRTVLLWDMTTHRTTAFLSGRVAIESVVFSPDGRLLAASDYDDVLVWEVPDHRLVATLEGHKKYIHSLTFSPDGTTLATGGEDKTVRLWDVATGTATKVLKGRLGEVESVAFHPDGTTLATGSGRAVRLWDVATGRITEIRKGRMGRVESVAFSPDGETLAIASMDTLLTWHLATGTSRDHGPVFGSAAVTFSPDGSIIACANIDNTVQLFR